MSKVIFSLVFFLIPLALAQVKTEELRTEYHLKWNHKKLKVDVAAALGPQTLNLRETEFGIVTDKIALPIDRPLRSGKLTLSRGQTQMIYLFVKNSGKKTVRFSVAPHSIEPGRSALGFTFNCLCNGHTYEVPAGQTWYRIMSLTNKELQDSAKVVLVHDIFPID